MTTGFLCATNIISFPFVRRPCSLLTVCHLNQFFHNNNNNNNLKKKITTTTRLLRERKPPPMPKLQPKVNWDSNPDLIGQRQSFCQVWYKSAVGWMRNTNKCPKIPYSSVVKKIKNWSRIHMRNGITTKSWSVLEGHPLPMHAKFGRHPFPCSSVILFTEWQTEFESRLSD